MAAGKAKGIGGVAQLVKLLDQGGVGGRGRRSSLSRWMRAHHDAFAAMLADKEPVWDEVATALAAMGLLDGEDKAPTGERARKAWWGVRRAKLSAAAKGQVGPAPTTLAPGEIAPAVYAAPATGQDGVTLPRPRATLDLRPATPLDARWPSPAPAALAQPAPLPSRPEATDPMPAPSPFPQEGDGAGERMRGLLQRMNAGTVPLPKVVP